MFVPDPEWVLFETDHWWLNHCVDAKLPGYMIVGSKNPDEAQLTDLPLEALSELAPIFTKAQTALLAVLRPERVYFSKWGHEPGHSVHFHVIPIYDWVLDAYRADERYRALEGFYSGDGDNEPDGPDLQLFVVREFLEKEESPPVPGPTVPESIRLLREHLDGRAYYARSERVGLTVRLESDQELSFQNALDPEVQRNYNHRSSWRTLEEYKAFFNDPDRPVPRFKATIVRLKDEKPVGSLTLSPRAHDPDLSINVFRDHRGQGLGPEAFALGVRHLFGKGELDHLSAGAYEHNEVSIRMLEGIGFRRDPDQDSVEKDAFSGGKITQLGFRLDREDWDG